MTTHYTRTRFTWFAYLSLAYFGLMTTIVSALIPFLRQDYALTFTLGSLHLTLMATGTVLIGLVGERILRAWGRGAAVWRGAAGIALGASLIAVSPNAVVSLGSSFVLGISAALLMVTLQASLSDYYGPLRGAALAEASGVASMATIVAPFWVGTAVSLGLGWRGATLAAAALLVPLALAFWRVPLPAATLAPPSDGKPHPRLPGAFWMYAFVQFLVVAVEWGIIAWGGTYLAQSGGLATAEGVRWMSIFFTAMVIGRFSGRWIAERVRGVRQMYLQQAVAAVGFLLFWLAPSLPLRLVGLFIVGLGISNLYPFVVALADGVADGQTDLAMTRLALIGGFGILLTPLVLGWAADRLDLQQALGIIGLLLVASVVATAVAGALGRRHAAARLAAAERIAA